jgi:hypothetical protein
MSLFYYNPLRSLFLCLGDQTPLYECGTVYQFVIINGGGNSLLHTINPNYECCIVVDGK